MLLEKAGFEVVGFWVDEDANGVVGAVVGQ